MASKRQIAANRRNARKSTGPKTPEGKRVSRMNALKHGVSARSLLLDWEDPDEFDTFGQCLRRDLAPEDAAEEMLVEKIIQLGWRLERGSRAETAAIRYAVSQNPEPGGWDPEVRRWRRDMAVLENRDVEKIMRYETSLENRFYRALNELRRYREARRQSGAQDREHWTGQPGQASANGANGKARTICLPPAVPVTQNESAKEASE